MSFTNNLFVAVYTEDLLGDFYDNYKNNKWFSREENGEFKRITISSKLYKDDFISYWKSSRVGKDLNIYKFNNESTFTLIMYNSTDIDSLVCKEIILKQYSSVYNRNVKDWKEDGIIIYDLSSGKTDYPTYTVDDVDYNIFYPDILDETDVDEVFICGCSNINLTLIEQFMNCNEKLYIFENNQYKIYSFQTLLKNKFNGQFCGTRIKSKSYQAFSFFRDPVENIKPADSKAFSALVDYSNLICFNFTTLSDWKNIEKIKKNFEQKMLNEKLRKDFVDLLFGEELTSETDEEVETLDIDSLYEETVESNKEFEEVLSKYSLNWLNNVVALNTMEIPSVSQIEELVSNDQKYSMIVTFNKGDNDFWTIRAYRTPRPLNSISINDTLDNNIYYLYNGTPIKRISSYTKGGKIVSVKWYYASSSNLVDAKVFTENSEGEYVLSNTGIYVKFKDSESYTSDKYLFTDDQIQRFTLTNDNFLEVCLDNTIIKFNSLSLFDIVRIKYLCKGNSFIVEMSLTDKQFYSILYSKSIY